MMRVSNAMVEQIVRAGGASCNQKTFALLAADLRDARALLAKLNGVQFATTEERLAVVAEVSAYLAGGDRG